MGRGSHLKYELFDVMGTTGQGGAPFGSELRAELCPNVLFPEAVRADVSDLFEIVGWAIYCPCGPTVGHVVTSISYRGQMLRLRSAPLSMTDNDGACLTLQFSRGPAFFHRGDTSGSGGSGNIRVDFDAHFGEDFARD